ncbi:MAG: hypothetical protein RSA01_11195 [Clostridium sp.]
MENNIKVIEFDKIKKAFGLILIAAIFTAIGNTIQTNVKAGLEPVSILVSFKGSMVIFGVAMVGYLVSQMPYLKKMSPVFWVGIVAVLMSSPIFPLSGYINKATGVIQFAALGTPTLAYAGLALGKDLPILKKMSWRIVIVGLAVISGTFLFGTIASQILLIMEGII